MAVAVAVAVLDSGGIGQSGSFLKYLSVLSLKKNIFNMCGFTGDVAASGLKKLAKNGLNRSEMVFFGFFGFFG